MDNKPDRAHVGLSVMGSVIAPAREGVTPPRLPAEREETERMPLALRIPGQVPTGCPTGAAVQQLVGLIFTSPRNTQ